MITTESKGIMYTSTKAGGWNGGDTVSEVVFEDDEEIIGMRWNCWENWWLHNNFIIIFCYKQADPWPFWSSNR